MNTDLRARAVQAALTKYRKKPFVWGRADCLHLARTVLAKIGATGLPRLPRYSSELTAIRRLKEQGHETLESLLSEYCIEIPRALAIVGDLGVIEGDGALSAIVVSAGGKWLGWPADHPTFAVVSCKPDKVYRLAETEMERRATKKILETEIDDFEPEYDWAESVTLEDYINDV